jgi:peptidyl-prolyl cis-trans isomerase SurA
MLNKILILFTFIAVVSCKTATPTETANLGTIAGTPIAIEDFKYVYEKNNNGKLYTDSSLKAYMDLYVNFRLKVKEAEAEGLDSSKTFQAEFAGYKKQLAQPYLTEKDVSDKLISEAYERLKEEVRASHILIMCKPDADPRDTLIAYNKIKNLRDKTLKGEDFATLAYVNSEDPSAKTNKGDLGYFTALQMVYPFEEAAYNTPKGSVSNIIRTRFGYHVLKVTDRRASQGEVRVAHIMIRYTAENSKEDSITAIKKIDELYTKLKEGENWSTLTKAFSEDLQTRDKDGELPWFSTGRMLPSFEEAAYGLKNQGDYSKPIQTPYGWHILKLIDKRGLGSFEELKPSLTQKVNKDSRSELNKKYFIEKIKKDNHFKENIANVNATKLSIDSSLVKGTFKYANNPKDAKLVLFTIEKDKYSKESYLKYVALKHKKRTDISPIVYADQLYQQFVDESNLQWEENHLESKYIEYRMLVKEYRDGILLFDLMDKNVWTKAVEDTVGLKKFFETYSQNYQWKERANAVIVSANTKQTLTAVENDLSLAQFDVKEPASFNMNFGKNTVVINTDYLKQLDKFAIQLYRDKKLTAYLLETNIKKESLKAGVRADSIKSYLVKKGIDASRIMISVSNKPNKSNAVVKVYAKSTSKKALEAVYNSENPLAVQITEGLYQQGDNEWIDKSNKVAGKYYFEKDGRYYLVIISAIETPRPKLISECRGNVISDYQTYLEKEWLKSLKAKYPVIINEQELLKLSTTK